MTKNSPFISVEGISHTRQLEEDMGIYNGGCKCHSKWIFYVEEGEVIEYHMFSKHPAFLVNVKDDEYKHAIIEKNGQYFEKVTNSYGSVTYRSSKEDILPLDVFRKTKPNGSESVYFEEECPIFDDCVDFNYNYEKEIKKLADGVYEALVETGCWATEFEGIAEGDGDGKMKVMPFVTLSHVSKVYNNNPHVIN